jgi:dihydropteroate synthase
MFASYEWLLRDRILNIGRRPLVMGIVNVTPDSFSDGGQFFTPDAAVAHGLQLVGQGADILDIGGESTRPGAVPVSLDAELSRVMPVIERLVAQVAVPLSIDTSKAEVARQAMTAGAAILNDVTGLTGDADMPGVVQAAGAGVIVMHMQGTPQTMQLDPQYAEVVAEIHRFFEERLAALAAVGIEGKRVVLDPGIGFGKKLDHNLELLARLAEFQDLSRPLCLGISRKGFINRVLGQAGWAEHGVAGTLGVLLHALAHGTIQIARVHDVAAARAAFTLFLALEERASR